MSLCVGRAADVERGEQPVSRAVEYPDQRCHHAREKYERRRDCSADALRPYERDGFWSELAKHDMEEAQDEKADKQRSGGMDTKRRRRHSEDLEYVVEDRSHRGLTYPAKRE